MGFPLLFICTEKEWKGEDTKRKKREEREGKGELRRKRRGEQEDRGVGQRSRHTGKAGRGVRLRQVPVSMLPLIQTQ